MIPLVLEMLAASGQNIGPSFVAGFVSFSPPYEVKVYLDSGAEPYTEYDNYLSEDVTSRAQVVRFNPTGDVLAVGTSATPYIHFYDNGAKLANPASLPAGAVNDLAWSDDGTYCAVACSTPAIYKRTSTFAKLSSPFDVAPPTNAAGCAFSDDGTELAFVGSTSTYFSWYKRTGDAFAKLSNPASMPGANSTACAWSPGGAYLAVMHTGGTTIKVYKRTADALSASGISLPTIAGSTGLAWSADGNYLAVGLSASPYFAVLKRTGDTFAKLTDPVATISTTVERISFSGSDRIAIRGPSNGVLIYTLESDVLTQVSSTGLPTSNVGCFSFNPPAVPGSP
jgi:WD40 repeat protein